MVYPPNYSLLLLQKNIAKNENVGGGDADHEEGGENSNKKMTLPLENDLPNPNFVRLQESNDDQETPENPGKNFREEAVPEREEPAAGSFLKSILLDRMTRKRSFGEDETPYVVKKSAEEKEVQKEVPRCPKESPAVPKSPHKASQNEDCNDILRRRLLGLKDPNYDLMQRAKPPPPQTQVRHRSMIYLKIKVFVTFNVI